MGNKKHQKRKSYLFIVVAALALCGTCAHAETIKSVEGVDLIVVKKSQRVLHLMRHWRIVKTFPIALGQSPVGHKEREGDSKTPEGFYEIDGRNRDSDFFRSLHISYPSPIDRYFAKRKGYSPGGDIVIHGQPNDPALRKDLSKDWTQGCIALSNRDMAVVWASVAEGTPIIIDP